MQHENRRRQIYGNLDYSNGRDGVQEADSVGTNQCLASHQVCREKSRQKERRVVLHSLLAQSRQRQAKAVRDLLGFGFVPGPPIHIGLDASRRGDSTALVAAQEQEIDGQPRIRLGSWIWERPFDPRTKRPVADWMMPIEEVYDVLLAARRWFYVEAVPHDPALLGWEVRKWLQKGMPMVEINQGGMLMERAGQGLYEAATTGLIAHDGNAGLSRHIANAASKPVARGSGAQRLVKVEQSRKMDAAVSAAMAIWSLLHPPEPKKAPKKPPSIYIMDDDDDDDDD